MISIKSNETLNCAKAQDLLLFTITNSGYLPFVRSFIKRLQHLKVPDVFYVVCTDQESYNELIGVEGIRCLLWECSITKQFVGWKTSAYKELVFVKFDITKFMLEFAAKEGIQYALYTDCDIWVFRDFKKDLLAFANKYSNVSLFMQDGEDYSLDPHPVTIEISEAGITKDRDYKRLCTGFMLIKPCEETAKLFDYRNSVKVDWKKFVGNQPYLNAVLIAKNFNAVGLPRDKGINGSAFSISGDYSYESLITADPWFVHYTYLIHSDKLNKLKENNHWYE
jgi:hypothetical protein